MNAAEQLSPPYTVESSIGDDRAMWLKRRSSGLGASEIAICLGASGWESILGLYYKKIDDEDPVDEDRAEHLQWGKLLEDAIIAELSRRAGVTIAAREPHLRSTIHTWALATPDAVTTDGDPVECKNIAWGFDEQEWELGIPEKYYLQCQHQMLVCGAERCLFGALLYGSRMLWEWVPRDEVTIARIIAGGSEFWECVTTQTEPPSDGHPDARKILGKLAVLETPFELFESEIEGSLVEWQTADAELKKIRADERAKKQQRDAAADQIAQAMGKHRTAYTATGWSFSWTTVSKKGFTVAPSETENFKIKAPK